MNKLALGSSILALILFIAFFIIKLSSNTNSSILLISGFIFLALGIILLYRKK